MPSVLAHKYLPLLLALMLGTVAFLQYANTLSHNYAWDDSIVITGNERVQKGIAGIPELFTRYRSNQLSDRYGFRPLVLISFALENEVAKLNPQLSHFFNVLYFALLCMVIFGFLYRLFGKKYLLPPLFITLLFTVHPIHSEVVANIKSRDEIFMLLFSLLAMQAAFNWLNRGKRKWLFTAIGLFLLALWSKESALFFVYLIPLSYIVIYTPQHSANMGKPLLLLTGAFALLAAIIVPGTLFFKIFIIPSALVAAWVLPYFIAHITEMKTGKLYKYLLSGTFLLLLAALALSHISKQQGITTAEDISCHWVYSSPDDEYGLYLENTTLGNPIFGIPHWPQRWANGFLVQLKYLSLFIYPKTLLYYYGFNQIPVSNWQNWQVWLSLLLHIGLLFAAIATLRKYQILSFGLFFYLITLFPLGHFVKVLDDILAERLFFTPSLGLCILLISTFYVWYKPDVLNTQNNITEEPVKPHTTPNPNAAKTTVAWAALTLFTLLCGAYSYTCLTRNRVWEDTLTLLKHDMPYLQNCARANYSYAIELLNNYPKITNETTRKQTETDIVNHLYKSIDLSNSSFQSFIALANAFIQFNRFPEAEQILSRALYLYPKQTLSNYTMGKYYYFTNNYKSALIYLQNAHKISPKHAETYYYLAWTYYKSGMPDAAIDLLKEGMQKLPDFMTLYGTLSDLYYDMGLTDEAMDILKQALQKDPDGAPIYDKIIQQYIDQGQEDLAKQYYTEAQRRGLLK